MNWDATENLIIEGDNLEVLKLLQRPYHGQVKMIYIDPPYNTGNEFIYPDNFREGLADYLRFSGQVNEAGFAQSANKDTSGRYHSNWLNMMYPRLFLARNLLREDGVIFVSIDDHEVHNLRHLMDEVFGEENFVVQFTWKSRKHPDSRAVTGVSTDHEYIVCYGRSTTRLHGIERDETKFSNPDSDARGSWMSRSILGLATREQRPNLHYAITDPSNGQIFEPPVETGWRYNQKRMLSLIAESAIIFPRTGDGRPREKKFRADMQESMIAFPSIIDGIHTADGTSEIRDFFGGEAFDFPKPSRLLASLISQGVGDGNAIILDFFAGSGTTAQAVLELNAKDGGNRKFILVQLPEKTDNPKFPTIADITRERVRRVIAKLDGGDAAKAKDELQATIPLTLALSREGRGDSPLTSEKDGEPDRGFRAFRLAASNFRVWDPAGSDAKSLEEQIVLHADNVNGAAASGALLYELILRAGLPVSARVVRVEFDSAVAFNVNAGELMVCVEDAITLPLMREMIAHKPTKIVCLDKAFAGDDAAKTNARLEAESHGVVFQTA